MSSKNKQPDDPLRPHVYDGIQEFDNRLPNWWLWTLYAAIIFSVIYWFSYTSTDLMITNEDRIDAEMALVEEAQLAAVGDINNDTLWKMATNPGFIKAGESIYIDKCVACHGVDLKGGIGLNLVDNEWKWGNQAISIFTVVKDGSPDKKAGMQSWINELGAQKVSQVVAYVLSHHTPEDLQMAESLNPPIGL
jgi:cytochrome c oxidase cbb3-type subunit 3